MSTVGVDQDLARSVVVNVLESGQSRLTPSEARTLCVAYGIPMPREAFAETRAEAVSAAAQLGFPVVLKVVASEFSHKSDIGGVVTNLRSSSEVADAYDAILGNARALAPDAEIGVQVQEMLAGRHEIIVGAVADPVFGPLVSFGLGGVLVETLKDVTFRLAPVDAVAAEAMLDSIAGADLLKGLRGAEPASRVALADVILRVSRLAAEIPEIREVDLNPVMADATSAIAVDARIVVGPIDERRPKRVYSDREIRATMGQMLRPRAVAVVGASAEPGKIGNSVVKNLVEGGFVGSVYPVNPRGEDVLGLQTYTSVSELPSDADLAVVAIPARLVPALMGELGANGIHAAVLIPSGFSETGNASLQEEVVLAAEDAGVRFVGPNTYGLYYTPKRLCATFCTPYDVVGSVALVSQSGGIGMAILGFSRSTGLGVSAIIGAGNKADVDEDDFLTFFEHDDATACIALHMEDIKDGRAFVKAARRVSKTKPIVVLKAGATAAGRRAAASHTAALAGDDKVYDDMFREAGVVRAHGLREMLEFARALPTLPTPKGENVVIITGAGGSGVLLADACVKNGLRLMAMPDDLDAAFRELIPPFGAAGNPVDITGGEPPSTYRAAIDLGLSDPRVDALILGYWHTIITPPMVFAELLVEAAEAARRDGIDKPIVVSLAGDVEVEAAAKYLFEHRIPAYAYTTETPVEVLAAKFEWARRSGALAGVRPEVSSAS